MSKKNKNKKPKYVPTGEYIGIDTGFIQAATLLDVASVQAIDSGDYSAVARLANQWLELSRAMKETLVNSDEEDHPEEDDEDSTARVSSPVGFGTTIKEIKDFHDRASQN